MTNLYKASVSLLLFIMALVPAMVNGQTTSAGNWQLGLGIGSTNYYGDLSNYRINGLKNIGRLLDYNKYYIDQPSFSVMLHKKLTPTLGFMIQANNLQFAMSDRYRRKNGTIDSGAMNYSRSLNFRTTLQDVGIAFTFSPNNGRIGPEDAFFYPSFFLGVGVSKFTVKGDLYDENNNPYNYRLPGNIMDGTYESNLRDFRTETDSKFRNVEPYVDLGLALNFRISQSLTIALQSDIKYSASDYLDDVSMKYKTTYATPAEGYAARPGYNVVDPLTLKRGDDNGMNDFYINNRLVLHIGLSKKSPPKKFNPPVIYSLNAPYIQQRKNLELQKKVQDSLVQVKADSITKAKRDSLISDSIRLKQSTQVTTDTSVQKQLNSISSQLQEVKTFLRDQQTTPRRQQLQYQSDSLKAVRNRILNQRSISREDNLRVRIYGLQLDSLQNEMNRLNRNGEYPAGSADTALRYYNQPDLRYQVPPSNQGMDQATGNLQSQQVEAREDSIYQADIRTWENEVRDLKRDNRYKSDAAYKKTVDSLQKKLLEYRRKDPVTSVNSDSRPVIQESSRQAEAQSEQIRLESERKLDSLQRRLDSLENVPRAEASATPTNIDSLERAVGRDSIADERAINELTRQQQLRADSVALLRRQLQRSADSVAFYQQQVPATRDTVVQQKKKWYQNIFRRGKNKKEVTMVTDPSSTDTYVQREQEHNEQLNTTRARIEQLERDSANDATISRQNQTFSDQQVARLQEQLKHNADSVAMLRRRVQQSSDSAAYYKALYASEEVTPDNRQQAKWYQDIFTSEKKMKKKRESEESSRNRGVR